MRNSRDSTPTIGEHVRNDDIVKLSKKLSGSNDKDSQQNSLLTPEGHRVLPVVYQENGFGSLVSKYWPKSTDPGNSHPPKEVPGSSTTKAPWDPNGKSIWDTPGMTTDNSQQKQH